MGMEHSRKGSDVQLGPVSGLLERSHKGGRNWKAYVNLKWPKLMH